MAQGEASVVASVEPIASTNIEGGETHDLEQYAKILKFRDVILSGNHPTIKLPSGENPLSYPIPGDAKSVLASGVEDALQNNSQLPSANAESPVVSQGLADASAAGLPTQKPSGVGKIAINPIFLEKSDNLIRAEVQIQRQRLEDSLKEDIEQRRATKQVQAESLLDFNLSDILTRALTLVQAATVPITVDEDLTANHEAASDSFDDNTFYSSQHDTPESNLTSRIHNVSEPEEVQVPEAVKSQQGTSRNNVTGRSHLSTPVHGFHIDPSPRPSPKPPHDVQADNTGGAQARVIVPGLNNYIGVAGSSTGTVLPANRVLGRPVELVNLVSDPNVPRSGPIYYQESRPHSPVVRNHDLVPVAPQPAKASALNVVNEPSPIISGPATAVGTPAQVAALRNEFPTATSSDSSSQGGREAEKRRAKKKKRRADRQVPEPEAAPYIKPEPRSASPMTAPSYIRPNKRQRQADGQTNEPGQAEPSYVQPRPQEQLPPHPYRDQRIPVAYEGHISYPQRAVSTAVLGDSRYGREFVEPQLTGDGYIRRPQSPYQHSFRETHAPRAVSQVIMHEQYRDPSRVYREPPVGGHISSNPEPEPLMAPPRPPMGRIVVDAYGREYIESPLPSTRQSATPHTRAGEGEIIYERVPSRAMTGHPGPGPYEDSSVVYTRQAPAYVMPRRYVTQPEYSSQEYRDSQHREFSSQPIGAGEYVQVVPQERRSLDERPREYISRASSIRPPEPVRYEAPYSYGRMHSARPEVPGRDYGGNVYAEGQPAEVQQPYMEQYPRSGSIQQQYIRRERPAERFHEPAGGSRGSNEIAFIERPGGATQEIVYVDDARREIYHLP